MKYYIALLAIVIISLNSCQESRIDSVEGVQSKGELREIMKGNLDATINLSELQDVPNLYALGPMEGLQGEIQIINSRPYVSQVSEQQMDIDTTFSANAAMLVYAQVPEWKEIQIPKAILTLRQFEDFLEYTSVKEGIDTSKPFPFMLEGAIRKLEWHVVDWDVNSNLTHSHETHQLSGLKGVTVIEEVQILGFFSRNHAGVYVPHDSNWHMHFVVNNGTMAAHVDNLLLGEYMTLKLPKQQ